MKRHSFRRGALLAFVALLAGCASSSPENTLRAVDELTRGRTAGVDVRWSAGDEAGRQATVRSLLAQPLQADTAVRIALLQNPDMAVALAALGVEEAAALQAARLPNPHLALSRSAAGDHRALERVLQWNVMGLVTLPWRQAFADQQIEQRRLSAAQDVARLAAETRKAWVRAVAAQQSLTHLREAHEAAEAAAELARRMGSVGNWSRLRQERELAVAAEVRVRLARAEQLARSSRDQLSRLMGLWGGQTAYTLPERLPDLPRTLPGAADVETQALDGRLDVRLARLQLQHQRDNAPMRRSLAWLPELGLAVSRETERNLRSGERESSRGLELEWPLPVFDQGQDIAAGAHAEVARARAQLRAVAITARSEAREAWHLRQTAWDVARHQFDEVVPRQRLIQNEVLLRYNGMLASVWDLLAEVRRTTDAVDGAVAAQRDFWLADTDLQLALTATSPGAMTALASGASSAPPTPAGH